MRTDQELIADIAEKLGWEKHIFDTGLAYRMSNGKPFPMVELPSTYACLALLDVNKCVLLAWNKPHK